MAGASHERRAGQSRRPGHIVSGVALFGVSAAMPTDHLRSDTPPRKMEEGEVAESKRRGEDAVDEHLDDEVFVDAVDDDAPDDFDDDDADD